jgi:branched-chain amino acid aminotransferase
MIPYDKRSGKIWYNSELVDWADAKIHVLNHGLHYASCVFEGERVYDGSIFKLEEHTSRLFYSAKRMGMTIPYSEAEINDACNKIIAVQKVENGYVRPTIWRGKRDDGNFCTTNKNSCCNCNMGVGVLL